MLQHLRPQAKAKRLANSTGPCADEANEQSQEEDGELCVHCNVSLENRVAYYYNRARVCRECMLDLDREYRHAEIGNLWAEAQGQKVCRGILNGIALSVALIGFLMILFFATRG